MPPRVAFFINPPTPGSARSIPAAGSGRAAGAGSELLCLPLVEGLSAGAANRPAGTRVLSRRRYDRNGEDAEAGQGPPDRAVEDEPERLLRVVRAPIVGTGDLLARLELGQRTARRVARHHAPLGGRLPGVALRNRRKAVDLDQHAAGVGGRRRVP